MRIPQVKTVSQKIHDTKRCLKSKVYNEVFDFYDRTFPTTVKPQKKTLSERIDNFMDKSGLGKVINNCKSKKEEKLINKHFEISDSLRGTDAYNELFTARKGLANYAKSKNVKISIANGDGLVDCKDKLILSVSNLDKKARIKNMNDPQVDIISKNVNKTYTHSEPDYFVVNIPYEDTQIVRHTSHDYENESFLKHIYRNVSNMANKVTK